MRPTRHTTGRTATNRKVFIISIRARWLLGVALATLIALPATAQSLRAGGDRRVRSGLVVSGLEQLTSFGKSVDWSPDGELIATSRPGFDGFFDVVLVNLEGTIVQQVTRWRRGCPQLHNGNPTWHRSGEHLVFTAENDDVLGTAAHRVAIPGRGVNNNLWLARADGSQFWQLTHHQTDYVDPHAVIHPQLSPDGSRLLWAERSGAKASAWWGEWEIKVARLVLDDGPPHLEEVTSFQPGERQAFYEAHDWAADEALVLFSGNLQVHQPEYGLDIYFSDPAGGEAHGLTDSFLDWDEHAHWSPNGRHVTWMSSRGFELDWSWFNGHNFGEILITELWAMAADGSRWQRLTYFNQKGHPHAIRGAEACIVSDSAWSPDGTQMVVNVYCRMKDGRRRARLMLLELAGGEVF